MITEIFYTKNTLYIFLEKNIEKNTIESLKKRLYYISNEYNIDKIIINIEKVNKIDDFFYILLEDYRIKFNNNLEIKNR
ncbi:MAG: hypothetical protein PHN42_00820 [Bacilli bacterium]|nr:hypothetical protein [Bacilli bacterium]